MKRILMLIIVSLCFVSCMELESPLCQKNNRVDIKLPKKLTINLFDEEFNLNQNEINLKRLEKGVYQSGEAGIMEVCKVAGKTILQSETEFGTYKIFSYSIGENTVSFPDYIIQKEILDAAGISYQIIERKEPTKGIAKKINIGVDEGVKVMLVEELPKKLISDLITLSPTMSFSY
ncbi:hypothetical protein N9N67_00100 [Bacteriovoracaceae bacterium]|nr:hypothetical protein [Bacteriovoracaceae bacterium]